MTIRKLISKIKKQKKVELAKEFLSSKQLKIVHNYFNTLIVIASKLKKNSSYHFYENTKVEITSCTTVHGFLYFGLNKKETINKIIIEQKKALNIIQKKYTELDLKSNTLSCSEQLKKVNDHYLNMIKQIKKESNKKIFIFDEYIKKDVDSFNGILYFIELKYPVNITKFCLVNNECAFVTSILERKKYHNFFTSDLVDVAIMHSNILNNILLS